MLMETAGYNLNLQKRPINIEQDFRICDQEGTSTLLFPLYSEL